MTTMTANEYVVTVGDAGYRVRVHKRTYVDGMREWGKTTRVYGAIDALVPELAALEPYANPHYSIPRDPETAEDKLRAKIWRAWKNGTVAVATERLIPVVEQLQLQGVVSDTDGLRARFAQNAGCPCGCSPGFVLDARLYADGGPADIWIDRLEDE